MAEKKTLDYYMALPYQEVIVAAKEGGYVGYIPELKGCITQSETKAGILDMLEDAKASWLEAALEDDIDINRKTKMSIVVGLIYVFPKAFIGRWL